MASLRCALQPSAGLTLLSRERRNVVAVPVDSTIKDGLRAARPPSPPRPTLPPRTCKMLPDAAADARGKGAISLLQEYVQCSSSTPMDRPVLQWSFCQRSSKGAYEFRAMVAFVLDGVPHHAAGCWRPTKKNAQRDAANRVLGFLVGAWGEALLVADSVPRGDSRERANTMRGGDEAPFVPECQVLEDFCARCPTFGGGRPTWSVRWESNACACCCASCRSCSCDEGRRDGCVAEVDLDILGVRHRLAGVPRSNKQDAMADAARRVLWYLRAPGFEYTFELDPQAPAFTDRDIPLPPDKWVSERSQTDASIHQNVA